MIHIGDFVKPTKKAFERNSEFSEDKVFIVTSIEDESLFSKEEPLWVDLAAKGDNESYYTLPVTEIVVVKPVDWNI